MGHKNQLQDLDMPDISHKPSAKPAKKQIKLPKRQRVKPNWFFLVGITMLFVCVSTVFSGYVTGNDGFWHMAVGKWICEHKAVPDTAIGAWGGEDFPWLAQEWLYEALLYILTGGSMRAASFLSYVLGIAAMCGFGAYFGLHKDAFRKIPRLCVYCFGVFLLHGCFAVPRPQTVSVILFGVLLVLLQKVFAAKKFLVSDMVLFFGLGVLWANFHLGTAVVGYLVPFAVSVACLAVTKLKFAENGMDVSHAKRISDRASIAALIMLVSGFLTPHGLNGFLYPFQSVGNSQMVEHISEWHPPSMGLIQDAVAVFLPFALFFAFVLFSGVKLKVHEMCVVCMLFLMALFHMRIYIYFDIALFVIMLPKFKDFSCTDIPKPGKLLLHVISAFGFAVCFLVAVLCFVSEDPFSSEVSADTEFYDTVREHAGERMYNYYDIGSQLMYYGIPVFLDPRYDPFDLDKRTDDMIQMEKYLDSRSEELDEILERRDFTSFVAYKGSALSLWLEDHEGYTELAESEPAMYEFWVKDVVTGGE